MKNILILNGLIISILLLGCKTSQSTTGSKTAEKKPSELGLTSAEFLQKIEKNKLSIERLNGDADMDYEGQPMNISASSNVRYRRDSLIWMNVKKLGFNVVRAQITPDSVVVINYMQGNVMRRSLKYLEDKLQIPVNFDILQKMLLGQPVFMTAKEQLKVHQDTSQHQWVVTGMDEHWKTEYRFSNQDFTLQSMTLEQPTQQRILKMLCDRYDGLKGEQKFAYLRTLSVTSPSTGSVKVTIDTAKPIEVDVPKPFKFDIPAHYPAR